MPVRQTHENGTKYNLLKESVYTILLNNMTKGLIKLAGIIIATILSTDAETHMTWC